MTLIIKINKEVSQGGFFILKVIYISLFSFKSGYFFLSLSAYFLVVVQVKPSSNQVNLASCCVMPPDLTAFAKEFDIQLLTHNDSKGSTHFLPPFSQAYNRTWPR